MVGGDPVIEGAELRVLRKPSNVMKERSQVRKQSQMMIQADGFGDLSGVIQDSERVVDLYADVFVVFGASLHEHLSEALKPANISVHSVLHGTALSGNSSAKIVCCRHSV
jgi:hypothetical protein